MEFEKKNILIPKHQYLLCSHVELERSISKGNTMGTFFPDPTFEKKSQIFFRFFVYNFFFLRLRRILKTILHMVNLHEKRVKISFL